VHSLPLQTCAAPLSGRPGHHVRGLVASAAGPEHGSVAPGRRPHPARGRLASLPVCNHSTPSEARSGGRPRARGPQRGRRAHELGRRAASGVLSGAVFRGGRRASPMGRLCAALRTSRGAPQPSWRSMRPRSPQLRLENALLWRQWRNGPPTLHALTFDVALAGGGALRRPGCPRGPAAVRVRLWTPPGASRGVALNGFPLLIRGAGWSPDEFLPDSSPAGAAWTASALAYTRDMGLNTIRLEV